MYHIYNGRQLFIDISSHQACCAMPYHLSLLAFTADMKLLFLKSWSSILFVGMPDGLFCLKSVIMHNWLANTKLSFVSLVTDGSLVSPQLRTSTSFAPGIVIAHKELTLLPAIILHQSLVWAEGTHTGH